MSETPNTNTHTWDVIQGRNFLLRTNGPIDAIGTIEDPIVKKLFFKGLVKKFYETEYKKRSWTPFSAEHIEKKLDIFTNYIESKIGKFDSVFSLTFEHGILQLYSKDGSILYSTNAITLWDNVLKWTPEIQKIEEKTRRETEALRESVMTESMFGGSVIVKYAAVTGAIALGANSAINTVAAWLNGQSRIYNWFQRISEILLRTPEGTFERINLEWDEMMKKLFSKNQIEWDRNILKWRTLKILENLGYAFDPIKKTFTHIDRQVFIAASELIQKLSLQELRDRFGLTTATEAKLIETRKVLQAAGKNINWKYYTRQSLMGMLSQNVMHAIMWPVFFSTFTKRQTSANLAAWMAEWWLFTVGVKVGNKVWKIGGIVGKVLAPLVIWWAAAWLGHIGFDHLGGSQIKWEHFNGTDMYDYKKSVILHGLNLGAPEALDQINKSRESSINAAIPRFNWTEWFGKLGRKMPLTGGTGVTPDITFIQSRVHLGVDPSEWMGWSVNNRNKNQWNIEVQRYRNELLRAIFILIEQYQKNQPPFFVDDSKEKSFELFSQILETHVLSGIWANFYQLERWQIAVAVISEMWKWKKEKSPQFITDVVDNYLSSLYMDEMSFSNERFRQEGEKMSIEWKIAEFEQYIQNPNEKKYFQTIFTRMQNGERIFEADEVDSNPFSDRVYIKQSWEHKLFNSLLKNKNTLPWWPEKKQVEIGKVFANLLDIMSDHVVRRDSMKRLSQIPWNENGGYWEENEWIKAKVK